MHVIDASDPLNPTFVSCFGGDGYVHDAQCVIYHGPDIEYQGHEICFCYNAEHLTVVDVTDKDAITLVSRTSYEGVRYTHQVYTSVLITLYMYLV